MRMAKALVACTAGYSQDPASIVSDALFECDSDDLVVVRDISCYSMCEHHMLPFMGKVHIGYLPQGKVVGLSKLARLTDCFSKRLQIQERLTRQIAEAVRDVTGAAGVAVMCEASSVPARPACTARVLTTFVLPSLSVRVQAHVHDHAWCREAR